MLPWGMCRFVVPVDPAGKRRGNASRAPPMSKTRTDGVRPDRLMFILLRKIVQECLPNIDRSPTFGKLAARAAPRVARSTLANLGGRPPRIGRAPSPSGDGSLPNRGGARYRRGCHSPRTGRAPYPGVRVALPRVRSI